MIYQGVKFRTEFVGKDTPSDQRIEELKEWCRKFHKEGLAPPYEGGSFGNLSFRLKAGENRFIITGSKVGLKDKLADEHFVEVVDCDPQKGIIYAKGKREPSSESMLHFAIYEKRPEIGAVFHGHDLRMEGLDLPRTQKKEPYGTLKLVNSVLKILDDRSLILMKDHGFISLGRTMKEAGERVLGAIKGFR